MRPELIIKNCDLCGDPFEPQARRNRVVTREPITKVFNCRMMDVIEFRRLIRWRKSTKQLIPKIKKLCKAESFLCEHCVYDGKNIFVYCEMACHSLGASSDDLKVEHITRKKIEMRPFLWDLESFLNETWKYQELTKEEEDYLESLGVEKW